MCKICGGSFLKSLDELESWFENLLSFLTMATANVPPPRLHLTGNYPPAPEKKCLHPGPQVQTPKHFFLATLTLHTPIFVLRAPILWASTYYVACQKEHSSGDDNIHTLGYGICVTDCSNAASSLFAMSWARSNNSSS